MPHLYCSREGCEVNNINSPFTHFHRIPVVPAELPERASKRQYIKREGQLLLRAEIADRCTFKRGLKEGAYRICEEHEFETVKKSKQLTWGKDKKGKPITGKQAYDLYILLGEGPKSTMCLKTKDSRGIGSDRRALKTLDKVNQKIKKGATAPLVVVVSSSAKKNKSHLQRQLYRRRKRKTNLNHHVQRKKRSTPSNVQPIECTAALVADARRRRGSDDGTTNG